MVIIYGYLGSLPVFIEAGMMCAALFLINRLGAKYAMALAAFLVISPRYFTLSILIFP